jgi:GMP reductase
MTLGKRSFKLPIVPANMKSIIDQNLAKWLADNNYFYIMHRFNVDLVDFCKTFNNFISISVGVNEDSYRSLNDLKSLNISPDFITIDIAHGHSIKMKQMLAFLKDNFSNSFTIAGNVCTQQGVNDLESWGADCVKVGIGPGYVCTTKLQTGFSRPQFSAVLSCAGIADTPIIADGGIEHPGDIAKALVAGASFVMIGHLLAGFEESPGTKVFHSDGRVTKSYFGSASASNKNSKSYIEGRSTEIAYAGSIKDRLIEIEQALKSSISYAGGSDLSAFRSIEWIPHCP